MLMGAALPTSAQTDTARYQVDTARTHKIDTLREIRLTGSRPLTEKKLDRTIVHVDALLANTGGHAWDVLENTPGVTLDEEGTISLEGKSGVLVLIDDRPTYLSADQLMNYLKSLPASQLEQVELLPTPPARYPASGGAGIIIIRTKKAKTNGFQTQLSSSYAQGIYPKTTQSLSVLGQHNAWQINAMGSYSYTQNWYNSNRYRDYFAPDGSADGSVTQDFHEESWQHSFDYSLDVEHQSRPAIAGKAAPNGGTAGGAGANSPAPARGYTAWGFLVNGSTNPYHEVGHYTDGFYGASGNTDSVSQVLSHFHSHTSNVSANTHVLRTMAHKGRSLSADADYVHYTQHPLQMESTTTTIPGDTATNLFDLQTQQPFTADIYGLKADYTDKFGLHTSMESGVQSTWSVRQNAGTYLEGPPGELSPNDTLDNTFRYAERIRAAYLTLRREGKRFSLQAGLRLENTNGQGQSAGGLDSSFRLRYTNLFPSVHALWSIDSTKRHQLGFSYARRIDRPDYSELNPTRFFFDQNTYFSGNPALQPQFSNNLELSYTYLDRYTLTASYSATQGSINMVFIADGADFYYYSINMDREVITGLSADASTPLTASWSLNTHAEWMYRSYRTNLPGGLFLDKTLPCLLLSGSTRYTFKRGWSAEVSGSYRSESLLAQSVFRPTGRLNGAIRKRLWKNKATLTLSGSDVLRTGISARFIYLQGALVHFSNVFDRRQVALTFNYTFGKKVAPIQEHASGAESERARL